MKRINIVKYSIVVILISLVFIFTSCKKSTADILSDALALDKLNNYQLTMNITQDSSVSTYKFIKDSNKFEVNGYSNTTIYYVLNDTSYDVYHGDTKDTVDGSIYTFSDNNFMYYSLCFYQIDTSNSNYDKNNQTYNLNMKKDITVEETKYVEEGSATFLLENNRIVKFSYDINITSDDGSETAKFSIDGTIACDKIDVTIPDITA